MFVRGGEGQSLPIPAMPGIKQYSVDKAIEHLEEVKDLGIPAVMLFGIPDYKDENGSSGKDPEEAVQRACREIKNRFPELVVITDVCLCGYTSHGHCGIIREGDVNNDLTLNALGEVAASHARAGADMVAPSNMMDGFVQAIRAALDEEGFKDIPIMAYSAKFASNFYGPFRDAAECAPSYGDRKAYQMDPPNVREAAREVALDMSEGADILIVKPGLTYMDVIKEIKEKFHYPLAVYNVSGEYAMIKAAAEKGCLDEKQVVLEIMHSFKRAGADMILTYFAIDVAKWLREGN